MPHPQRVPLAQLPAFQINLNQKCCHPECIRQGPVLGLRWCLPEMREGPQPQNPPRALNRPSLLLYFFTSLFFYFFTSSSQISKTGKLSLESLPASSPIVFPGSLELQPQRHLKNPS